MIRLSCVIYLCSQIFWFFCSESFINITQIGLSFLLVFIFAVVSGLSNLYYKKAVNQLERKRMVMNLLFSSELPPSEYSSDKKTSLLSQD